MSYNLCFSFNYICNKLQQSAFLELEADEEEEEGLQAGLGDFGFGVTKKFGENDDEQVM